MSYDLYNCGYFLFFIFLLIAHVLLLSFIAHCPMFIIDVLASLDI